MKDFRLPLEETLRMLSDAKPEKVLGDLFVEYLKGKTLSNSQGVAVSLQVLGVEDPWAKIAARLGQPKEALTRQFEGLVSRRNDVVHRGDRDPRDPNGPAQDMAYAWTDNHVRIARSVVLASEELVAEQVRLLRQPVVEPPISNAMLTDGQAHSG